MFELESGKDLGLGLLTGIAFGFLLQKGRVAKYQVILGQLLLKDWTVIKVMLTAVVTGAIGVYAMIEAGTARLDIWPFQPAAMLIGAAFFGIGIAIIGYCPGTGLAGAAEGSRDAMVGVAGMLSGAALFVAGYNVLEPLGLMLGDFDKLTIPDALGFSPWAIVVPLAILAALAFLLADGPRPRSTGYRQRGGERRRQGRPGAERRARWAAPA